MLACQAAAQQASPPALRHRLEKQHRMLRQRLAPAGLLLALLLHALLACSRVSPVTAASSPKNGGGLSSHPPTALNAIIPTFSAELDVLTRQVRSVLLAGASSSAAAASRGGEAASKAEALRLEEVLEEVAYDDDDGAQKAYEATLGYLRDRKDDLRANGCATAQVLELTTQKWTALRLQKLHTLYVADLSPKLRSLRSSVTRDARRRALEVERSCISRAYVKINGVDGPQPVFRPNAPGKPGHEDEPITLQRLHDVGPDGLPWPEHPDETDEDRLIRLGELAPEELEMIKQRQMEAERARTVQAMMAEMRSTSDFDSRCEIRDRMRAFAVNGTTDAMVAEEE